MVTPGRGRYFLTGIFFVATGLAVTASLFDDEIAGWFAKDREGLTPLVSVETRRSSWDLHLCIDEMRVAGLGMQSRNGPRKFTWTDQSGVERTVNSYDNRARDTRLDVVDFETHRVVEFYGDPGRAMRKGEEIHLAECLDLDTLPTS